MVNSNYKRKIYIGIVLIGLGSAILSMTPLGASIIGIGAIFFIRGMFDKKNEDAKK
ncbi:MAG: hypothetical protein Q8P20_01705 [bacterium]|nr:hypothetical protein [bacterium]